MSSTTSAHLRKQSRHETLEEYQSRAASAAAPKIVCPAALSAFRVNIARRETGAANSVHSVEAMLLSCALLKKEETFPKPLTTVPTSNQQAGQSQPKTTPQHTLGDRMANAPQ